ncbi:MAG: hypothetical protein ACLQU4_08340 [Limisphaerales bacterium]
MRKKDLIWIGALLVVGGIYIHYFTHWFDRPTIGIAASIRPSLRAGEAAFPVFFTLSGDYKLTSLKVVPMAEGKFNPVATPVWHLVSDSNSVPTRAFRYGQGIRGMKPALKGIRPEPLTPGTMYRLILTAGSLSGSKDFQAKAVEE